MDFSLRSDQYGIIPFLKGFTPEFDSHLLPGAESYHARGSWGIICFQQIQTKKIWIRHFLSRLKSTVSYKQEGEEGLQSLINLHGQFEYRVKGLREMVLREKEFILFNPSKSLATTTLLENKFCSFLNVHYSAESYQEFIELFAEFEKDLKKTKSIPLYFLSQPIVARFSVHDLIKAAWADRYVPTLQKKHVELRFENSLFTMLAQSYTENPFNNISPFEKKKANAALQIILKDIKMHFSADDIAVQLHCSSSWLQKAFSKVYGVGMYHYLRRTRMEKAKELLLKGEQVKAVALEVGMKARNFSKEFKSFYGYTISQLKKSLK